MKVSRRFLVAGSWLLIGVVVGYVASRVDWGMFGTPVVMSLELSYDDQGVVGADVYAKCRRGQSFEFVVRSADGREVVPNPPTGVQFAVGDGRGAHLVRCFWQTKLWRSRGELLGGVASFTLGEDVDDLVLDDDVPVPLIEIEAPDGGKTTVSVVLVRGSYHWRDFVHGLR